MCSAVNITRKNLDDVIVHRCEVGFKEAIVDSKRLVSSRGEVRYTSLIRFVLMEWSSRSVFSFIALKKISSTKFSNVFCSFYCG